MEIEKLKNLKETEDKVEFKEAKKNFNFDGGSRTNQKDRRKCYLGYIVALANEGGGRLVFGMTDVVPRKVVGTNFAIGKVGSLEDEVYKRIGVRVHCTEHFDETGRRVLVTKVPSRPLGKMLRFEGVPLMRPGDSMRNMNDDEILAILSENEPDFSAKICKGLSLGDLDDKAFERMILDYQIKNKTSQLELLPKEQILSDFNLLVNGKLNYAALILLGKKEKIAQYLPQCKIIWEFRNTASQIHFDRREEIQLPLFLAVDAIWGLINQPTLNKKHPIQFKSYIFDIYDFNEEVIREALLNAIAHRDYTINSEIVIKQYPDKIVFSNPGGFPKGVTLENILKVNSTPRSRLMTEIMQKTGLVERSGQGVDKIFSITLSEGKAEPSYKESDIFQVTLMLSAIIEDTAFHIFIQNYKLSKKEPKLGVEQIITLCKINKGMFANLNQEVVNELEVANLIERTSVGSHKYMLSSQYQDLYEETLKIGNRYLIEEIKNLVLELQDKKLKIGELEVNLKKYLNRNQIKYLLTKLLEDDILNKEGIGKGTFYFINKRFDTLRGEVLINAVVKTLKEKYE
jgi:ATP-dependent DNA helicase RecG